MGFFKTLFGSTDNSLQVPHDLQILAEEMKEHAMVLFKEGKEPSVVDMKLYDGRIAIQCEYELIHWQNYKSSRPEQLHVSISFPHDKPSEQDIDLIMLVFFNNIEDVHKQFGASGGVDVIHLKRSV